MTKARRPTRRRLAVWLPLVAPASVLLLHLLRLGSPPVSLGGSQTDRLLLSLLAPARALLPRVESLPGLSIAAILVWGLALFLVGLLVDEVARRALAGRSGLRFERRLGCLLPLGSPALFLIVYGLSFSTLNAPGGLGFGLIDILLALLLWPAGYFFRGVLDRPAPVVTAVLAWALLLFIIGNFVDALRQRRRGA